MSQDELGKREWRLKKMENSERERCRSGKPQQLELRFRKDEMLGGKKAKWIR